MKIVSLLFLLWMSATVAKSEEHGYVAGIAGNDRITCVHLYNLLRAHGIDSSYSGGVIYDFDVPLRQVQEARQLIRRDARKRKYNVGFGIKNGVLASRKPQEKFEHLVAFAEVLTLPAYFRDTALGKLLRREEVTKMATEYPYVDSMRVLVRRYLAAPAKLRTAYQVDLHFNDRLGPNGHGNSLATFYIDEDGHDVGF